METSIPATLAEDWLVSAYELLEAGWCQNAEARDPGGLPVEAESSGAVSWSLAGAVQRAWRTSDGDLEVGLYALQRANLALVAATGASPQRWNDAPPRTKRQVLEALVVAISLVRSVCWHPARL
jgi:hypothetical protein